MYGLFDSGKMGMVVTGPWQLSDITDHHVSYGVQVLPSFNGSHETISGPTSTWSSTTPTSAARRP